MLQVLTPAEIAEHEARDKAMFDALSTADKLALASIRYRLRNADDKDAIAHFVRQTVNGIHHDYADGDGPIEAPSDD
ncbi:MAG: hypothetical protein ACRCYS_04960 [Beijerinckiaceae bacterium]